MPPELREAKALTKAKALELLNRYLFLTDAELKSAESAPDTPQIDRMIIAVIKRGTADGEHASLNFLLDRTVGKSAEPPQEHNFNFHLMPREQVIALGVEAIKYLKAGESK